MVITGLVLSWTTYAGGRIGTEAAGYTTELSCDLAGCREPLDRTLPQGENDAVLTQQQLIGRDVELAAIRDVVASASGDGGVLILRGEAGIGKSSLLAEAVTSAAAAGHRVLRAGGVRTEGHLPFAGLHQLLRPLLGGLDSLPPPQRSALEAAFGLADRSAQDPFLVSLATLTLLTDAAGHQPVVAVVDDAQWLDRPTDETLGFVARRLGSDPVALILAILEGEEPTAVESVGLPIVQVQPLGDADARELLERRSAPLASAVREHILREAAGNPLALVELPAAIDARSAGGTNEPLPVTARLEQTFARKLADMPAATSMLLLLASVDDAGMIDEIIAAGGALGLEDPGVKDLEPAVAGGLVAIDDGLLRFRHPMIRSTIAGRSADGHRREAHQALASVVSDSDRAASHAAAAATRPDEATAALVDAAAERAERRGAMAVAVTLLESASRLSPNGQARGERLLRAVDRAYRMGRQDIMLRLLQDAGPLEDANLERRRQAWLRALRLTGPKTAREEENVRLVVDAARQVSDEDIDFAMALLTLAATRSWWMDLAPEVWAGILEQATAIAPDADDPRLLYIKAAAGREYGAAVVERVPDRLGSADSLDPNDARILATSAMWAGDLDTAYQLFGIAVDGCRGQGRLGYLARAQIVGGWCALQLGRLSEAIADLDEGLRLSVETDQENFIAIGHAVLAQYHALRGDLDEGAKAIAVAERHGRRAYADGLLANVNHARGLLELAAGRHADAFDSLRHMFQPGDEAYHTSVRSWAISELVDAAIPAARSAEAAGYLQSLDADPAMAGPWQRITLAYARAVLEAAGDDDAAADAAFSAAMAADLERWPLPRARLLLAYGTWLRRRRRVTESRDPLRRARELFDAIGVPWLADRARRELGATGEVSGARVTPSMDDLTPQELQIARLAAGGLSNREIGERLYVSHRTVGYHLYHVYPKLGISGRAQLYAALGAT